VILETASHDLLYFSVMYVNTWPELHLPRLPYLRLIHSCLCPFPPPRHQAEQPEPPHVSEIPFLRQPGLFSSSENRRKPAFLLSVLLSVVFTGILLNAVVISELIRRLVNAVCHIIRHIINAVCHIV